MKGSKILFFCTSRGFCAGPAGGLGGTAGASLPAPVIGVSHTTVPGIAPCRVLPAPMTSTRPRTVVAAACVVAWACNPAPPAHITATQIRTPLGLILESSSLDRSSHLLRWLLPEPLPSIWLEKNAH